MKAETKTRIAQIGDIVQVKAYGHWLDFVTVKDSSDIGHAETTWRCQAFHGVAGEYRIVDERRNIIK